MTPLAASDLKWFVCCRVSFEDIEILGHWCGAHIVKSYLTGMPVEATLMRAGHFRDTFVLPRGRLPVPEELGRLIFPGIDDALAAEEAVSQQCQLPFGVYPDCWTCCGHVHASGRVVAMQVGA